MDALPKYIQFSYANKKVTVVHGSYHDTSEFIFKSTPWKTKQHNFDETGSDIILGGHCGLPFSDKKENLLWLNPGVIGMPANDGTPRVWYMLLNDTDGSFSFSHASFEYDNVQASELMKTNGLPGSYAKTLIDGNWDNCEILPKVEAWKQGHKITYS